MFMMEELKLFLALQIKQLKKGTFIFQTKYNLDMLNKFDMDNVKPIKISMASTGHLDLDKNEKAVSQNVYRSVIESLLCICASRYRGGSRRGAAGATASVAPIFYDVT
jgi:hypothetical protein